MSIGEVSRAVKLESTWLKLAKLLSAIITCVIAIFICSYFLSHWSTVKEWQDDCVALLTPLKQDIYCTNSTAYDFSYASGPFSDEAEAKELQRLLGNCDAKCQTIGVRWSTIYWLCGFANLGMILQSVLLAAGVYVFPSRMVGLFFQAFCSLFYFAVVIVTAVFRFNDKGRLAALSQAGSAITDVDGVPTISTERTYEEDGQMILRLWSVSMAFLIGQCCLGGFSIAPPT